MISPTRCHAGREALIGMLVLALVAGACSRKKPPATDVTTTGGDTTTVARPPVEDTRPDDTMNIRLDQARGTIAEKIYFDFNRAEIRTGDREILARKADVMSEFPEIAIRIEGHADERGTVEYNLALGERRAQAAKDYLVNAGIDPNRVSTISYGEERPSVDASDEEAWSQNRRDEFVITGSAGGDF